MSFHSKNIFSKSSWLVPALVKTDSGWERLEVRAVDPLFKVNSKELPTGFTKELSS